MGLTNLLKRFTDVNKQNESYQNAIFSNIRHISATQFFWTVKMNDLIHLPKEKDFEFGMTVT